MTTNHRTAAELLLRAADVIETDGWTQGQLGNVTDGWCTIGAIHQAAARDAIKTNRVLNDAIDALWHTFGNVGRWNDHPDRTEADVLEALRQTADTLTEQAHS